MARFILKPRQSYAPSKHIRKNVTDVSAEKENVNKATKENMTMVEKVMTTQEKIDAASAVLGNGRQTKRMKADKGLIERTESSKTVLTEDNKELLID